MLRRIAAMEQVRACRCFGCHEKETKTLPSISNVGLRSGFEEIHGYKTGDLLHCSARDLVISFSSDDVAPIILGKV